MTAPILCAILLIALYIGKQNKHQPILQYTVIQRENIRTPQLLSQLNCQ